jgi:peptidoglycan/LPS O-acetylase OafA/YrhL
MNTLERRYDIDWIRVIAIGLLLIYHVAIGFQKWGIMIGFIANDKAWDSLWIPMSMLNVWRIPLLFFVSGMGVYFAMQNRNWKQLLGERTMRILLPFVFGIFCIVPIHLYLWKKYYNFEMGYTPDPGHLWFLGNIFIYVVVLLPLLYLMKRSERVVAAIAKLFSTPLGLLVVVGAFLAEGYILKPVPYEMYAMTKHGFALGALAFFFGFCFVLSGSSFLNMIIRWRWLFLVIGLGLYLLRINLFQVQAPFYLLIPESQCWIFTVIAFGSNYLNRPGKVLTYLSQAAYPVYILHMIFLYLGSYFIFRIDMPVYVQFVLVLLITLIGCFAVFELLIRRVPIVGLLFGVKQKRKPVVGNLAIV